MVFTENQAKSAHQYLSGCAEVLKVNHIVGPILNDPNFFIWSGSCYSYNHHYGKHGLILHTSEVTEMCLLINKCFNYQIDTNKLFLSAFFHDVGKLRDYKPTNEDLTEWGPDDHKYKIHHVSRSLVMWNEAAKLHNLSQETIDEVAHVILSHHGQREWGSPVSPQTKMAWLLHLCDGISARLDDCERNPKKWKESK